MMKIPNYRAFLMPEFTAGLSTGEWGFGLYGGMKCYKIVSKWDEVGLKQFWEKLFARSNFRRNLI